MTTQDMEAQNAMGEKLEASGGSEEGKECVSSKRPSDHGSFMLHES